MGIQMKDGIICPTWNEVEAELFTPGEIAERAAASDRKDQRAGHEIRHLDRAGNGQ